MLRKFRHSLLSLASFGLIAAAVIVEGGHLSSVMQVTTFIFVTTVALGLAHAVDRKAAKSALAYVFFRKAFPKFTATEEMRALEMVEKSCLVAGVLSAGTGIIHLTANVGTVEHIGPGVAVSFVSLIYCFAFNAAFVIPAKLDLLASRGIQTKGEEAVSSLFSWLAWIGLAGIGAGLGLWLQGAEAPWYLNWSGLLLAGIQPFVVHAFYRGAKTSNLGLQFYGNLVSCGALVAVIIQLIRVMENLDKPEIVMADLATSAVPLLYGFAGAFYFKMAAGVRRDQTLEEHQGGEAGFSYLPFMSFSILSLAFICALVVKAIAS